MSVFVCGNTHCPIDIAKLGIKLWSEQKNLFEEDLLIILGDFGGFWSNKITKEEQYWLKWLTAKNCTVCFLDGNHENFDIIYRFPVVDFCEGKAGLAYQDDNGTIFHLKRGEIYNFEGKKVLTFGGATSVDKEHRIVGQSWWPEEVPNYADVMNLDNNLKFHNNEVDFILTHTCPKSIIVPMGLVTSRDCAMFGDKQHDPTTTILQSVLDTVKFKEWHMAHFHKVLSYENRFFCHYNNAPVKII